ncbi:Peptidoglycan hydrolase VirB1, involved in T-DNA transfer [Candidatus Burkholderia verschuerenii]|uniref:Peptidoglycan hydrolase VirB1, involved in T-DNA transfer n=1 Tax=Candidatus Burkholderia verschuerenii TaxID=242163 RepID=A0A0L0MGU2_9BURK|nr:lytic transglycosylase domain-containing protein [Candidatus Burkholderia verschuerenii]KND61515.1 Peptidoglycan hydrolase VirB1, involved in T-DNA transfer [Candidatus Burkholderia verschuerenii]
MILTVAAFVQLAAQCGPAVHVDTLTAMAQAESRLNTFAIHDNKTGRNYAPATLGEAVTVATDLVAAKHHSVDLGVMQVNSANLAPLGLTISDTFDACKNIAAGARVLAAGYEAPTQGLDVQPALMHALSRYNTGNPDRGFTNGYVRRVQFAARQVVPAIRVGGADGQQGGEGAATPPPPPPSWDVFGQARYQREHGGIVFGGTPPTQPLPPATPPAGTTAARAPQPVQLQAVAGSPNGGGL